MGFTLKGLNMYKSLKKKKKKLTPWVLVLEQESYLPNVEKEIKKDIATIAHLASKLRLQNLHYNP